MVGMTLIIVGIALSAEAEANAEAECCQEKPAAKSEEVTPLTGDQKALLAKYGWNGWVGDKTGIWVSVKEQRLRIIEDGKIIFDRPCSTAAKGVGNKANSLMTPPGWHSIKRKAGKDAPWGQVFRSRRPTDEIWKPGDDTTEDLVLTRILILEGEEQGINKGGNVDSYLRNIYVHGTNDEENLGTPASHGCVRLSNDDVIGAFQLVEESAYVLITPE